MLIFPFVSSGETSRENKIPLVMGGCRILYAAYKCLRPDRSQMLVNQFDSHTVWLIYCTTHFMRQVLWWRLGHPHHVPLYIVYVTSLHSLLHRLYVFHYATYIPLCNIVFCHQHTNCNISFKSPTLSCYQHLQRRHCVNNQCLFGVNNSWCN